MTYACMHGKCALSISGVTNYFTWLQVKPTLGKITDSHFQVLIIQNANENMPERILIA